MHIPRFILVGVILLLHSVSTSSYAQSPGIGPSFDNWEIVYSYDGTNVPSSGGSSTWPPMGTSLHDTSEAPVSYTVKSEGKVKVTAKWIGKDWFGNPTQPPDFVNLRFYSAVVVTASATVFDNPNAPSVDADNGFGDSAYIEHRLPGHSSARVSGIHLRTFPVSNGKAEYEIQLSGVAHLTGTQVTANVQVDLTARPESRSGYMLPRSVTYVWREDGDLEAHTIYSLVATPSYSGFFEFRNYQRFSWIIAGEWSDYQPHNSWPYEDIDVYWDGLGSNYHYQPQYEFDYSFRGCYLQRLIHRIYQDEAAPYNATPENPQVLALKLKDNGDSVQAKQKLYLYIHTPADEWVEDSSAQYEWPAIPYAQVMLGPDGKLTQHLSMRKTTIREASASVDIDPVPILSPFVNIPISVKLGKTFSASVSEEWGINQELHAPPGAFSVLFWTQEKIRRRFGRVSHWNSQGLVGQRQGTACHWDDPQTYHLLYGFSFLDENGEVIE